MSNQYFTSFPRIFYDLSGNPLANPLPVTDIFFRVHILPTLQSNSTIYYPYYVKDNETPEDIASKYYGDPGMHWLVLMANTIVDPQFDWPLDYTSFSNYLIAKYGSIANAENQIWGYQETIQKDPSNGSDAFTQVLNIDLDTYNSIPAFTFQEINMNDGSTLAITTTTAIISCYTHEYNHNENKKNIQLIDKRFLDQIRQEFIQLTKPVS